MLSHASSVAEKCRRSAHSPTDDKTRLVLCARKRKPRFIKQYPVLRNGERPDHGYHKHRQPWRTKMKRLSHCLLPVVKQVTCLTIVVVLLAISASPVFADRIGISPTPHPLVDVADLDGAVTPGTLMHIGVLFHDTQCSDLSDGCNYSDNLHPDLRHSYEVMQNDDLSSCAAPVPGSELTGYHRHWKTISPASIFVDPVCREGSCTLKFRVTYPNASILRDGEHHPTEPDMVNFWVAGQTATPTPTLPCISRGTGFLCISE